MFMEEFNFDFDNLLNETGVSKPKGKGSGGKKRPKQGGRDGRPQGKEKKPNKYGTVMKPVKAGKVLACIGIWLLVGIIIFVCVGSWYTKHVRFPEEEEVDYKSTGIAALKDFEDNVHSFSLPETYYLYKETVFANSDKSKTAFLNKIVGTVSYKPDTVNAKNIYGNDLIDRKTMLPATRDSFVEEEGEEVTLSYVDYSKIDFKPEKLDKLITDYGLTKNDVNYANTVVNLFCDYISTEETLPLKSERRVPSLEKENVGYVVTKEEDKYLDIKLFSSKEFRECEELFTKTLGEKVAGKEFKVSEEWSKWNKLAKVEKDNVLEPMKYGKLTMSISWCGAYYLENEYYSSDDKGRKIKEQVRPQLGDGSFESPASISTPIITAVLQTDKNGKTIEKPIKVELVDFGVSEDALVWFQSKDPQNRGYNLETEVQYCYSVFKVTNLSDAELVVKDNSSLSDKNVNLSIKTGTIFGLTSELKLKPDETGYIESWGRSTELNKKYLIWGSDFARRKDPVWFRVLAGDLEDKSEDKGVHIIERLKKDSKKEPTTVKPTEDEDE